MNSARRVADWRVCQSGPHNADFPCHTGWANKTGPFCVFPNIQKNTKDIYTVFAHIKSNVN